MEDPDFECDTFFPDLLPSTGAGVKSTKWRPAPQELIQEWIADEVELPQHAGRRKESIHEEAVGKTEEESEDNDDDDGQGLWLRDDKAGVEIRVVGWQRR